MKYRFFLKYKIKKYKLEQKPPTGSLPLSTRAHAVPRRQKELVRFSSCHPKHYSIGCWYNVYLKEIPFTSEAEMLPNTDDTCHSVLLRKGVLDEDSIERHVLEYCNDQLMHEDYTSELVNSALQVLSTVDNKQLDDWEHDTGDEEQDPDEPVLGCVAAALQSAAARHDN